MKEVRVRQRVKGGGGGGCRVRSGGEKGRVSKEETGDMRER